MANQKRKVSHGDFLECYRYFELAIQSGRLLKNDGQDVILNQAKHAFLKIPESEISMVEIDGDAVNALQSWIDQFVDSKTWGKCYRAINQKRYLQRQGSRTITISLQAHTLLKAHADDNKLNLSQAIISLLDESDEIDEDDAIVISNSPANNVYAFTANTTLAGANIAAHFTDNLPIPYDIDIDWDERQDIPHKPADFKQNESYKAYRTHLKILTIQKSDDALLNDFDKAFAYYLTTDNMRRVGDDLMNLRQHLLDNGVFSGEFLADKFAISKPLVLSARAMDSYGYELIRLLEDILGCDSTSITSGKSEPTVFAGNSNHVQIAYKAFNYIIAFLHEEMENFINDCHKNTKKKNRYEKAEYHCSNLVYELFDSILDDECSYKLLVDEETNKLTKYSHVNVGMYYDENMPIGGR